MNRGNLIGKRVHITDAATPELIGLTGTVIDETKQTLSIRTKDGDKRLIKNHITITIDKKTIQGRDIAKRPEERIKE